MARHFLPCHSLSSIFNFWTLPCQLPCQLPCLNPYSAAMEL